MRSAAGRETPPRLPGHAPERRLSARRHPVIHFRTTAPVGERTDMDEDLLPTGSRGDKAETLVIFPAADVTLMAHGG